MAQHLQPINWNEVKMVEHKWKHKLSLLVPSKIRNAIAVSGEE